MDRWRIRSGFFVLLAIFSTQGLYFFCVKFFGFSAVLGQFFSLGVSLFICELLLFKEDKRFRCCHQADFCLMRATTLCELVTEGKVEPAFFRVKVQCNFVLWQTERVK